MLGEKTDFFPSKAKLKMAKLQNVHVEITEMHRARKLRMQTVALERSDLFFVVRAFIIHQLASPSSRY